MLISKEQFVTALNAFKEEFEQLEKLEEALKPFFDNRLPCITAGNGLRDAFNDLLVAVAECENEDDIFFWWLFDSCDKVLTVDLQPEGNQETYDVSTAEGLYDYLYDMYHTSSK